MGLFNNCKGMGKVRGWSRKRNWDLEGGASRTELCQTMRLKFTFFTRRMGNSFINEQLGQHRVMCQHGRMSQVFWDRDNMININKHRNSSGEYILST